MKKYLIMTALVTISALSFSDINFTMQDKKGDDKGFGKYTYPTNKVFLPGAFDLQSINITELNGKYIFEVTIPINFKNEWKSPNGWDVQNFDIYLRFDKGIHKQTLSGRNLKIAQGWDKVIFAVNEKSEIILKKEIIPKNDSVGDKGSDGENLLDDIIIPDEYKVEKNSLIFRIPKEKIKDMEKLSGVQVFLSGADGFPSQNNTYIRNVLERNSEWRFGGGSDYDGDSNVIDILGDNGKMKNYKISEDREGAQFAEVDMIDIKTKKPMSLK